MNRRSAEWSASEAVPEDVGARQTAGAVIRPLRAQGANGNTSTEERAAPTNGSAPSEVGGVASAAEVADVLSHTVVGVMAHNEGAMIEHCLRAILAERAGTARVATVVVVASGCTDRTVEVVRQLANEDSRVSLIVEPVRAGKAAAINTFLDATDHPYCALIGADILLVKGALVHLVAGLLEPHVGMTGARVVPTNPRTGVVGNAVHTLWELHDQLARVGPKLGEAVAFRRLFDSIPVSTLADEVSMEQLVLSTGAKLRYVPKGVVHNSGPRTIADYLAQRERIHRGHLGILRTTGYSPVSMHNTALARSALEYVRKDPSRLPHVATAFALEVVARTRARVADIRYGPPTSGVWAHISSAKETFEAGQHPGADPAASPAAERVPGETR